jgi:hypothetical protein
MTSRNFLRLVIACMISLAAAPLLHAEIPATEKTKIESLITHVETLKDTTFIRNGSEYDAKSAAKFLRGKWRSNAKDIKTATDFITQAATVSGTTGKLYLIRFKDRREVKCGEYLAGELKKLETPLPEKK